MITHDDNGILLEPMMDEIINGKKEKYKNNNRKKRINVKRTCTNPIYCGIIGIDCNYCKYYK